MSATFAIEMMSTYPPSIAATKKSKSALPEGFAWYAFEWLGDSPGEWEVMKVEGSMTRIAKSGKNKGKPIFIRGDSKKTVYITAAEVDAAAAAINKGATP